MPIFFELTRSDRLRDLEERAWKQVRCTEASTWVEASEFSEDEDAKLDQLWAAREEGLNAAEQEELYGLLRKCQIGHSDDSQDDYAEDDENDANEQGASDIAVIDNADNEQDDETDEVR